MSARDQTLAEVAKRHGANYSLRIIMEARRAGLPVSLAFALIEQESRFQNVFGHDAGMPFAGAGAVTKAKYLAYKRQRGPSGKGGMQGVGPAQLTYYAFQDRADKLGGAWVARHNIRVAFEDLAAQIKAHGKHAGIRAYNGTGPDAEHYANTVQTREARWHDIFSKEAP